MKWFDYMLLGGAAFLATKKIRSFFQNYEVLIFDKEDLAEDDMEPNPLDLRGTPTHVCICGSKQFLVRASFENYEISQYFLDMQCINCGSLATAPTLIDREKSE